MNQYMFVATAENGQVLGIALLESFNEYKPVDQARKKAMSIAKRFRCTVKWELFNFEIVGSRMNFVPSYHSSVVVEFN